MSNILKLYKNEYKTQSFLIDRKLEALEKLIITDTATKKYYFDSLMVLSYNYVNQYESSRHLETVMAYLAFARAEFEAYLLEPESDD